LLEQLALANLILSSSPADDLDSELEVIRL